MSRRSDPATLLRWYPASWRQRYGHEFAALLHDTFGDQPIPWRSRLNTARSGLTEHLRAGGLDGDGEQPVDRARSGSLLVLSAWACIVVAGSMYAKFNENWEPANKPLHHWLPGAGYVAIEAAAAAGLLIVMVAGLIALPALVAAVRASGWALIRPQVRRVAIVAGATVLAGIPLIEWAHHLSTHQRNGGLALYSAAFVAVGLLLVATVVTVTASVVSVAATLTLSVAAVRWLARLALALVGVMGVMVAGFATWWAALATSNPGVLGGRLPLDLLVVAGLMVIALFAAGTGARRIARTLPALSAR